MAHGAQEPQKESNSAEHLLSELIGKCFFETDDGNLEWNFIDDTTVKDILGEDIELEIKKYFKPA